MSRLTLYLLGPPRLERDGESLELKYHKNFALLAYLAVAGPGPGGETHTRESLITLLWPELEPSRARANLRRNLSLLRKALGGEWLVVDREMVGLDPESDLWLDVDEFRQLLAGCETHGHPPTEACPDCVPLLEEAVALYRDHFLAGFTLRDSAAFDEWQFFETEGLKDKLAGALVRLATYHTSQGDFEAAIGHARRWLALDPLHEPAHRHLMALYAQAGQQSAALRQYEECVRILEEELALPPSDETTALYEQIRAGPTERRIASTRPRHNLPTQSTPFIGREDELAAIKARLSDPDCRLLTLTGPGGSGKTRLALETAANILSDAQLDSFEHGVFFVSLAAVPSVEAIVPTAANAVGFSFYGGGDPQQQLLDYLRQKSMLLILDSCEHLLEGVGLVTEILRTAPGVKILATSRARLNVGGEHRFRVAGMDYPDEETLTQQRDPFGPPVPSQALSQVEGAVEGSLLEDMAQYSAVKLFLQGARRAQPSFELTDENLSGVVQVCRLVDGMPLGIRLASAWVEMLTPAEIAAEIGRSFDLLETDRRDVPARQRSIRAAVDHSWNLLTERERELFQALSVFRGGFTRKAARAVTGATLRELMALVNKSLLHRAPTGRYEVHELLRQYAEEKLDGSPMAGEAARDHHSAYYTAALQQWGKDLRGPRQQAALTQMDAEIENARAAWGWAVEHVPEQIEHLDRSLDGLCTFYQARGRFQEGEAACQKTAARLKDGASVAGLRVRARALAWQGIFAQLLGRTERARRLARLALELLSGLQAAGHDTRREEAFALWVKGEAEKTLGEDEEAKRGWRESLALCQALGDRWEEANVLGRLGWVASHSGLYDEAERLQEKSLDIRRALGDAMGMASALTALGMLASRTGRPEEATRLVRESIAICQEIGDRVGVASGYHYLSNVYSLKGEYAEAYSLEERALAIHDELGYPHGLIEAHWGMGQAKRHLGEYRDARVHCAVSLAMARETGNQQYIAINLQELGNVRSAEGSYAEAVPLLQESLAITRESGLRRFETLALLSLGYALRGLGDHRRARHHICAALRIAAEVCLWVVLVSAIPPIALLLADMGEVARAVELYALALRYPHVANSRWFEDVVGRHIAAVAATLPPEVVAAAQEYEYARDLAAATAELLAELGG